MKVAIIILCSKICSKTGFENIFLTSHLADQQFGQPGKKSFAYGKLILLKHTFTLIFYKSLLNVKAHTTPQSALPCALQFFLLMRQIESDFVQLIMTLC